MSASPVVCSCQVPGVAEAQKLSDLGPVEIGHLTDLDTGGGNTHYHSTPLIIDRRLLHYLYPCQYREK